MPKKLLRGHYTIWAFFRSDGDDWETPQSQFLNNMVTNGLGFNITCAAENSNTDINAAPSDTTTSMKVCDTAESETLTFSNYTVTADAWRNGPPSEGINVDYATFFNLFNTPDRPFIFVTRVGAPVSEPFAKDDDISIFSVDTDFPVDILADGAQIMFGARFKATGFSKTNYRLEV